MIRLAMTSAFFFSLMNSFSFCSNFHSSLPSPQALKPEFLVVLSSCSISCRYCLISASTSLLNLSLYSRSSSLISAALTSSSTSGRLKNQSYSLLSTLQKFCSSLRFISMSSCLDSKIIMQVSSRELQGRMKCIERVSPMNLEQLRKLEYSSMSKSIWKVWMFMMHKQWLFSKTQKINRPRQFSTHCPSSVQMKNLVRAKCSGRRGFSLTRMVSSSTFQIFIPIIQPTSSNPLQRPLPLPHDYYQT